RGHVLGLLGGFLSPWRRIGFCLLILVGDLRVPDSAPIRQLRQVGPVLRRRWRVDDGWLFGGFSGVGRDNVGKDNVGKDSGRKGRRGRTQGLSHPASLQALVADCLNLISAK